MINYKENSTLANDGHTIHILPVVDFLLKQDPIPRCP
jgi:hypothetical protein